MKNTIKCKNCGTEIEITDALSHQIKEQIEDSLKKEYEVNLQKIRSQAIEEASKTALKELEDKNEQILSLKKRAEDAEENERTIRKEKRQLAEAKEKFEVEKERQLDEERDKIKRMIREEVEEKDKLKFAEYEKKIADMTKSLDEAKNKGGQGSQQLQGEVLELDLENLLRNSFLDDEISEVGKGKKGGDIVQKVKGKSGKLAGIILWETKRAKWSATWIPKLKEDSRNIGASVAIIVATELPKDIEHFAFSGGILTTSYKYAVSLATILRRSLLQIALAKQTAEGKDENLEFLYQYIQSEAFRHRFESFAEGINEMQNDLDYEKRAMERIWKKKEIQIKKMQVNAARMYGELQGIIGNTLPDIKAFSLESGGE